MPFTLSHAVLAPPLAKLSGNRLPLAALAIGCMVPDLIRLFVADAAGNNARKTKTEQVMPILKYQSVAPYVEDNYCLIKQCFGLKNYRRQKFCSQHELARPKGYALLCPVKWQYYSLLKK